MIAGFLLLGGLPATAAALSGPAVLEAMLKEMGPAKTLKVRQRVESVLAAPEPAAPEPAAPGSATAAEPLAAPPAENLLSPNLSTNLSTNAAAPPEAVTAAPLGPVVPPVVKEELTYLLPGAFRAEIRTEAIHRIYLEVGGEALLLVDGRLAPTEGSWYEEFKDLFLFTRRLALHRHLALKGVDLAVASLGLWEERPVYVLGARFPDAAPSQIWVDKETLLPLRWFWQTAAPTAGDDMANAPGEAQRFEIRYDRWQLFGKRRYPLRVQFFENHELVRTLFAEAVDVDPEVDANLMDMAALREAALPPEETQAPAQEAEDGVTDEIQEAIDIFKKRYE